MLTTMSKSRKQPSQPAADKAADSSVLFVRMPAELEEAFQQFINAQRIKPGRTAVALTAIEELLTKEGYWPPKPRS